MQKAGFCFLRTQPAFNSAGLACKAYKRNLKAKVPSITIPGSFAGQQRGIIVLALQVGDILEGKVTGIKPFGAFVALPESKTGLVHISEVSYEFVQDLATVLEAGQTVKVKVISIAPDDSYQYSPTIVDLETDEWHQFGPYPESVYALHQTMAVTDQGFVIYQRWPAWWADSNRYHGRYLRARIAGRL